MVVQDIVPALLIGTAATVGSLAEWLGWAKELFSRSDILKWFLAVILPMPAIGAWLLANGLDEKAGSKRG